MPLALAGSAVGHGEIAAPDDVEGQEAGFLGRTVLEDPGDDAARRSADDLGGLESRQTLLEPVEWTADGWVKASGYDVARPIPMPAGGAPVPHGFALSDDFHTNRIGTQWSFFQPAEPIAALHRYEDGALVLKAGGTSPKDCTRLTAVAGDQAYELQVEVDCDDGAAAGLLVFYSEKLFAGLGFSKDQMLEYRKGETTAFPKQTPIGRHYFLRLRNDRHIVTLWSSADGQKWTKHWMQIEVSGYHHNVADGFLSLRPALIASGAGEVRFRNFRYRALAP